MGKVYGKVFSGGNFLKPRKWDNWKEGDFVEGIYERADQVDKYKKPIPEIRVTGPEFEGPDALQGVQWVDGNPAGHIKDGCLPLYPTGGLRKQLDEASYGDTVKITYNGKVTLGKKHEHAGEKCHDITVEIAGYVGEGAEPEESSDDGSNLLGN